ncbi:endonuclease V [Streptomyces sp. ICBB 8177]|uniref:endonuclease V n=1 Tax=Streptomyces sp. ICBB 8177 TaxID=563922 RepID=UPI000D67CA5A|nr:endonuclease V [Streptomyces sp. ICBB 8177]PWI46043.1 endonuclease V [Streptomyces sp. ICBB 8177]
MQITIPHAWPADAEQAVAIQDLLAGRVDRTGPGPRTPRLVAGLDVAYAGDGTGTDGRVAGAVVVLEAATGRVVDSATAVEAVAFPYVPGLFAFRELPALVAALERLTVTPDLLLCDGHGIAHPRRFGLACHLGVLTGLPTAGVAKTPFVGTHGDLGHGRGDRADLIDGGEVVGRALRTQDGVKPVYVSTGHAIDLDTACRHVLALAPDYRLPQTTRLADRLSRDALADAAG